MLNFFKALHLLSVVAKWSEKALKDNKITLTEALELVREIAPILGVPLSIDLPESKAATPGDDTGEDH